MPVANAVTRLWLLGHGIEHSPSPAMHNAALRATNLSPSFSYQNHDVTPEQLAGALLALRSGEVHGANVTIPHKRAAAAACDVLEGDALVMGAVNTLFMRDGQLVGENTDARGLEAALRHEGLWPAPGAAVVVLGAGGAAAAAALALSRSRPRSVAVAARRREAAAAVRQAVSSLGQENFPAGTTDWTVAAVKAALGAAGASVLVNATPAGLPDLPVDVAALPDGCTVIDLRYRPRPVDLVAAARQRGLPAGDGLEMLLQQGMLSLRMWTGVEPPLDVARRALHEAVGA
ncbi:MAG TPA: shikimate dehydrogenase [Candidatus Dormibacteraeota bacterium]|nr:shikimate dehydrogenase [Candidatus Dormibacteraeota bacterium]